MTTHMSKRQCRAGGAGRHNMFGLVQNVFWQLHFLQLCTKAYLESEAPEPLARGVVQLHARWSRHDIPVLIHHHELHAPVAGEVLGMGIPQPPQGGIEAGVERLHLGWAGLAGHRQRWCLKWLPDHKPGRGVRGARGTCLLRQRIARASCDRAGCGQIQ